MLLRTTDPFRDLDRLTQQLLGTTNRPAVMAMDAWREGDRFVIEFDLPGGAGQHRPRRRAQRAHRARRARAADGAAESSPSAPGRAASATSCDNLDLRPAEAGSPAGRATCSCRSRELTRRIEFGAEPTARCGRRWTSTQLPADQARQRGARGAGPHLLVPALTAEPGADRDGTAGGVGGLADGFAIVDAIM